MLAAKETLNERNESLKEKEVKVGFLEGMPFESHPQETTGSDRLRVKKPTAAGREGQNGNANQEFVSMAVDDAFH